MPKTNYIYDCKICQRLFKTSSGLSNHIHRTHKVELQEYYDKFIKTENEGICSHPDCNNHTTYRNLTSGYLDHCSIKCGSSNPTVKHQREETYFKKTGYTNCGKNPEVRKQCHDTYFKKTGYHSPASNPIVRKKMADTLFKRTGFRHHLHDPKNFNSHQYKRKPYILPSGKGVYVQGYEPQALDILLQYFDESEIEIGTLNIPIIKYVWNNNDRRYYADFWIPSINTMIEVKSSYTMKADYERNIAKHLFSIKAGYDHEFMVL